MYNLLMRQSPDFSGWKDNQDRLCDIDFLIRDGRMFQFTTDAITKQFTVDNRPDYQALIKFPCLFAYEIYGRFDTIGLIGRISEGNLHQ